MPIDARAIESYLRIVYYKLLRSKANSVEKRDIAINIVYILEEIEFNDSPLADEIRLFVDEGISESCIACRRKADFYIELCDKCFMPDGAPNDWQKMLSVAESGKLDPKVNIRDYSLEELLEMIKDENSE